MEVRVTNSGKVMEKLWNFSSGPLWGRHDLTFELFIYSRPDVKFKHLPPKDRCWSLFFKDKHLFYVFFFNIVSKGIDLLLTCWCHQSARWRIHLFISFTSLLLPSLSGVTLIKAFDLSLLRSYDFLLRPDPLPACVIFSVLRSPRWRVVFRSLTVDRTWYYAITASSMIRLYWRLAALCFPVGYWWCVYDLSLLLENAQTHTQTWLISYWRANIRNEECIIWNTNTGTAPAHVTIMFSCVLKSLTSIDRQQ